MKKYLTIIKINFQKIFTYRARVVIWAFVNLAHLIIFPFIWLAVYASGRETIGGYAPRDLVTYYIILAFISIGFISHISRAIKEDIMYGKLNTYLVKPINYSFFQLIHEMVYKCLSTTIGLGIIGVVGLIANEYFVAPLSGWHALLFFISLIETLLITHGIETILAYLVFWLGEIRALEHANSILAIVFSGAIAPLTFFPPVFQTIAALLPYQFIGHIPAQIYLGTLSTAEMAQALALGLFWIVALMMAAQLLWHRAKRK